VYVLEYVHVYHWYTCTYVRTMVPYLHKMVRTMVSTYYSSTMVGEQVPSQDDHPWNPQARTTTETVLREAMQALVRVQAHLLERIVVEIRAADIAVDLEP
jgi:hypothetical protein